MFRPLSLFVGLRYTRSKRRNGYVSLFSFVSIITLCLGVMLLIVILSVMNGFEKEVRERILNMISHITVSGFDGKIQDWQSVVKKVKENPEVVGTAPFIRAEGMLIYKRQVQGSLYRGIDPKLEKTVSKVHSSMVAGSIDDLVPGKFGIILGQDLAFKLGVDIGQKVTMVTPTANVTPAGVMPRLKRFTVVGIFKVGFYQYDSAVGLIHIDDAARVFRKKDGVSGVQVQVKNLLNVAATKKILKNQFEHQYWVKDWSYYHANWFSAVQMEKRMMFVILFIIIVVVSVNIISSMITVVNDKRSDIAIMRTFGAKTSTIMRIFLVQGSVIGVVGTAMGVLLGVLLSLNLDNLYTQLVNFTGKQVIDPSVYLISDLPTDVQLEQVLVIGISTLVMSIIATIIPAITASHINPADALRYE
ncbi:Lipoprotein releasing system transmembrane protein LolC/LolE [hydrothermal vent metagenome]|uniref:Lipoprotein releasing system transmembrane protein LolC/LolE n=1 Tax=hydrothermal vent metagenome TaxID=652676 RepID=A0A3B1AAH3_9ZZZZ